MLTEIDRNAGVLRKIAFSWEVLQPFVLILLGKSSLNHRL